MLGRRVYFLHDTLDRLAEQIAIAAAETLDENGLVIRTPADIQQSPVAAMQALDSIFGRDGWATLGPAWPTPDQLKPVEFPRAG